MKIKDNIQEILDDNIRDVTIDEYNFLVKIAWKKVNRDLNFKSDKLVKFSYYDEWEWHYLTVLKEFVDFEEEIEEIILTRYEKIKIHFNKNINYYVYFAILLSIISTLIFIKYIPVKTNSEILYEKFKDIDETSFTKSKELSAWLIRETEKKIEWIKEVKNNIKLQNELILLDNLKFNK